MTDRYIERYERLSDEGKKSAKAFVGFLRCLAESEPLYQFIWWFCIVWTIWRVITY